MVPLLERLIRWLGQSWCPLRQLCTAFPEIGRPRIDPWRGLDAPGDQSWEWESVLSITTEFRKDKMISIVRGGLIHPWSCSHGRRRIFKGSWSYCYLALRLFATVHNFQSIGQMFEGSFSIWQNFDQLWQKSIGQVFHCFRWSNILNN